MLSILIALYLYQWENKVKYSELHKKLQSSGCYIKREGKRHPLWYSPITGQLFPTSRHLNQEVKKGTLQKIIKQSGIKI